MLKVMIVEDEYIVREDLKRLIDWEEHGFCIVAEAKDGKDGLQYYEKYRPRIIITDIKMPVMGGLEMIKALAEMDKSLKFIILSAYGEFDFARKAIEFGIGSYLLKHEIDRDVLVKELGKLKEAIEKEDGIQEINTSNVFKKIIKEHLGPKQIETFAAMNNISFEAADMVMVILEMEKYGNEAGGLSQNTMWPTESEVLRVLRTIIGSEYDRYLFSINEKKYVILSGFSRTRSKQKLYENVNMVCSRLQSEFKRLFSNNISIAVSKPFYDMSLLNSCYRETNELVSLKMFRKGKAILFQETWQPVPKDIYDYYLQEYNNCIDSFNEAVKSGRLQFAKELMTRIYTDTLVKLEDVRLLQNCILDMLSVILEHSSRSADLKTNHFPDMFNEISQLDNVYQICEWLLYHLDMLSNGSDYTYTKKVKNAIDYIKRNYSKNISLQEVAESIGVSTIYTSQLFKKEVGESFITYLTKYRMMKAKELLESGKYKINEVSEMIGYQTVQYFCKTFKKITGKKPGDYYK